MEADAIPLQFPIKGTGAMQVAVEPGQLVHIPVRDGINVDPRIWGEDAGVFKPERWIEPGGLPDSVNSIKAPMHLLTFGDG